jgi:two-component system, NtrC family, response regulator AtoC
MVLVFIVEDDSIYSKILKKKLEENPELDIRVFQTEEECMNHLHMNPDVVTIDYYLASSDGLSLLRKIRAYNENIFTILLSGQNDVEVVVEAYRQGAGDYIIKNQNTLVELENSIKNVIGSVHLRQEVEKLKDQIIDRNRYSRLVGSSPAILRVLSLIQKVEKSNMMVLVTGESGTGKELVAQSLHYNSNRNRKPFVAVNVGAIPPDLVESELFGHEKGAFTDARERRIGKFEEANEGTLFLDEIGEMSMNMQIKLLRVLEAKEISRVGSNKIIKLDVRVVAATNKNLAQEVKEGRFRQDLFYRLQGFLIQLPPLRERGDDVLLLSRYFLNEFCAANRMPSALLSREASAALTSHSWPGNVRELKTTIERAALLSENGIISVQDLIFST